MNNMNNSLFEEIKDNTPAFVVLVVEFLVACVMVSAVSVFIGAALAAIGISELCKEYDKLVPEALRKV